MLNRGTTGVRMAGDRTRRGDPTALCVRAAEMAAWSDAAEIERRARDAGTLPAGVVAVVLVAGFLFGALVGAVVDPEGLGLRWTLGWLVGEFR